MMILDNIRAEGKSPAEIVDELIRQKKMHHDLRQQHAVEALDKIFKKIMAGKSLMRYLPFLNRREERQGLYLHGKVGRGKTLLMDIFFHALPEKMALRFHFQDFIAEVHDLMRKVRSQKKETIHPVEKVGRILAGRAKIICLDEIEVSDVTDAMIIERLFEVLFKKNVILVATSNFAPEQLYTDRKGIFSTFVTLLRWNCRVLSMESPHDYRRYFLSQKPLWVYPLKKKEMFGELFDSVTGSVPARETSIEVGDRVIDIKRAAGRVGYDDFSNLCGKNRGRDDYFALANRFYIFFLDNIPALDETKRNEARRFITLIDIFYDQGKTILGHAEVPIDSLYGGTSHALEFERTRSRLHEMHNPDHFHFCHEVVGEMRKGVEEE